MNSRRTQFASSTMLAVAVAVSVASLSAGVPAMAHVDTARQGQVELRSDRERVTQWLNALADSARQLQGGSGAAHHAFCSVSHHAAFELHAQPQFVRTDSPPALSPLASLSFDLIDLPPPIL